ncbi:MAG TPA: Sec-independent protein translocase protein TatB [Lysobacter sp.]
MFDIGFSELFVIAIVALIVLGPERLPKAARLAGLWVRRARAQWYSVKSELENELADEELKRSLRQTQADLREARDSVLQGGQEMRREFDELEAAARDVGESPAAPEPSEAADTHEPGPDAGQETDARR